MIKDITVENNLGLVHSCCQKFKGRGIEYEELYSAGCMGLVKAINNFNPNLGIQLSTYAVPVILGEIKRLFRDGGPVKVSRSLKELNYKINKAASDFEAKENRSPTVKELAQALDTSTEKINEALNSCKLPISLTAQNDDDENRQIDLPTDDIMDRLTEKIALKEAISQLEQSDQSIILLRYFKGKTQQETALILNMTQVQISRREKKILSLMRQKLSS